MDAPLILDRANHTTIAERCPQCFGPYVTFLEEAASRFS